MCQRLWAWDVRDAGWAAVMDRRFLIAKQDPFRRLGGIDKWFPIDDIRYVPAEDYRLGQGSAISGFGVAWPDCGTAGRALPCSVAASLLVIEVLSSRAREADQ